MNDVPDWRISQILDELVGDVDHPGLRIDSPAWHTFRSDPNEWTRIRRRQMAYINRYAPSGHPSAWDNVSVLEFVAYHHEVAEIIAAENNSSKGGAD